MTGDTRDAPAVAAGFLEIAVQNMANAIKKISVQRGYDVTGYVLSTFGGAGGQHACAVADALGMTSVLIHPLAGALSAYGIGLADVTAMRESAVEAPLTADLPGRLATGVLRDLEESARAELAAQGTDGAVIQVTRRVHLRYDGTDTPVQVRLGTAGEMTEAFERAYRTRFSFLMADKPIVVEAVSVEATAAAPRMVAAAQPPVAVSMPQPSGPIGASAVAGQCRTSTSGCSPPGNGSTVPLYQRAALRRGQAVDGPAIIAEDLATTVVEPGWRASVTERPRPAAHPPGAPPGRAALPRPHWTRRRRR